METKNENFYVSEISADVTDPHVVDINPEISATLYPTPISRLRHRMNYPFK